LKGKFNELLENEIRVLKTCDNENIIKLYDLKKTSNNFYLMLEYCNEGGNKNYIQILINLRLNAIFKTQKVLNRR